MRKYPLAKPYISKEEEQAVLKVLRSGTLSIGKEIAKFEEKFSKTVGTKFACAVSSGTAGLHLAMIAAGIKSGDEVITSPFSFIASANAILYVGAKPVFVDIDPTTYNLDPKKIELKINSRTKAILVVHIFGQAANMEAIIKLAKKHDLKIIEDACESLGATHHGRKVGTFGESAVFAFYPNKQITTGEGGMVVTDDDKIFKLCCSLRNQGRSLDMGWLEHERLGYNYRLDELSSALGVAQLRRLPDFIKSRRKLSKLYDKYLSGYQDIVGLPQTALGNTHSWFVYVIRVLGLAAERDNIIEALAEEGISSKAYLPSIHLSKFFRTKFHYSGGEFPISERVSSEVLALPFYIGLKEGDIRYISKILLGVIKNSKHGAHF